MKRSFIAFCALAYSGIACAEHVQNFSPAIKTFSDAIKVKSLDEVKNLIKAGLNPNTYNEEGVTPIHEAVMENQTEIVNYLLTHGANPNIPNRDNETALHHAALAGNIELVKKLSEAGVDIEYQARYKKQTPLFYSATVDTMQEMIKAGANVNARDELGRTPMYYIADEFAVPALQVLLRAGAHINVEDSDGMTPLHVAAEKGKINVVKALLANKANPNARDKYGRTPLYYTKDKNAIPVVKELLRAGAHINNQDNWLQTPLHVATRRDDSIMVKELLENKADGTLLDYRDQLAYQYARMPNIIDLFEKYKAMPTAANQYIYKPTPRKKTNVMGFVRWLNERIPD